MHDRGYQGHIGEDKILNIEIMQDVRLSKEFGYLKRIKVKITSKTWSVKETLCCIDSMKGSTC